MEMEKEARRALVYGVVGAVTTVILNTFLLIIALAMVRAAGIELGVADREHIVTGTAVFTAVLTGFITGVIQSLP